MPKVSVVMSSYNHGKFIGQAIQSVLDQTYTDLELVLFENGSTDNSLQVISSFTDPRIKVHAVPTNIGGTAGMNAAIARATGEYIALLNSDDFYFPDKLTKQITLLDDSPTVSAIFGLCRTVNEQGGDHHDMHRRKVFLTRYTDRITYLRHFFFEGNCICHPTAIIRKTTLDTVGHFDVRYRRLPDFDYWLRLFISYDIIVLHEELAAHRFLDDESNESGARPEVWASARWEYVQILHHFLTLDMATFLAVFGEHIEKHSLHGLDRDIQLGRIAIAAPHVSAQAFGLQLLFEALQKTDAGISVHELHNYTSTLDIYGIGVQHELAVTTEKLAQALAELELLHNSKSWKMTAWARRLLASFKSRRFY